MVQAHPGTLCILQAASSLQTFESSLNLWFLCRGSGCASSLSMGNYEKIGPAAILKVYFGQKKTAIRFGQ